MSRFLNVLEENSREPLSVFKLVNLAGRYVIIIIDSADINTMPNVAEVPGNFQIVCYR